jgi:Holliday junction resolvase-like predicted endonuclease
MPTYYSPTIWGAVNVYLAIEPAVSDICARFDNYAHENDHPEDFQAVVMKHAGGADLIASVHVNTEGKPQAAMTSAAPIFQASKASSTQEVVTDVVAASLESEARAHWHALTTQVDRDFITAVYAQGQKIFAPLESCAGMTFSVSEQSFKKSFIARTADSPVHGALKRSGEDLVCKY